MLNKKILFLIASSCFINQPRANAAILGISKVVDNPHRATFLTFFDGGFTDGDQVDSTMQVGENKSKFWKLMVKETAKEPAESIINCDNIGATQCISITGQHLIPPHDEGPGPTLGTIFIDRFENNQSGGGSEPHETHLDIANGIFRDTPTWTAQGFITMNAMMQNVFTIDDKETVIPANTQWILRSDLVHTQEPSLTLSFLGLGVLGIWSRFRQPRKNK